MRKLALTFAAAAVTALTFAAAAPASAQNLQVKVGVGNPHHREYHRPVVRRHVVVVKREHAWRRHAPAKKIVIRHHM
jgi:hypothetical protein